MNAAFYFAISELRRRPRHFFAQTIVSAAILTTLVMMLLYMNANWRNQVMPEKPQNYHFTVKGLTEYEKKQIRAKPYVLACYDVERYVSSNETVNDTLRVRVIWSENNNAIKYAWEIFDELELWEREVYKGSYNSTLQSVIYELKKTYFTDNEYFLIDSNTTLRSRAEAIAKQRFVSSKTVRNSSYCNSIMNSYTMQPEFLMLTSLIALFLGGVIMILQSENYRALMPEYGSLRSFGLKKIQLFYINAIQTIAASIAAIPIGSVAAVITVKIYLLVNKDILTDDSIYFKLTENIPISVILVMSLILLIVSVLGSILVCRYYRDRSTMQLLKREGSVQVSFVAKTSPRFERARSIGIYSSLQIRRTRTAFILLTAIIAIMMPLPTSFMMQAGKVLFNSDEISNADTAMGMYFLFQSIILFITSVVVIYIAARSRAEDRHGELAILRSLGTNKKQLRRVVYPSVVWQTLITIIPAFAIYSYLTDELTYYPTSNPNRMRHLSLIEFAKIFSSNALGIVLLVAPPLLLGTALSLLRFHRRSVIESIRENE